MPVTTRRGSKAITETKEDFVTSLLAALETDAVVERFRLIFEPIFSGILDPHTRKMGDAITKLASTVEVLKKESAAKDEKIATLQRQVTDLEIKMDDHEQHGRRDSVRIFGLSETSSGTTDEKVLCLCNKRMKLSPPLSIEEISVSHRVGKPGEPAEDGTPPPPRPLLVKFATGRSKNRVISERKELRIPRTDVPGGRARRSTEPQRDTVSENPSGTDDAADGNGTASAEEYDWRQDGEKVFMSDDITKRNATLAYKARLAKRNNEIQDTWVYDWKIMIKNMYGRISQIKSEADLRDKAGL